MNTFTINGKNYQAKEFDFNLVCDLQDLGVSLEEAGTKPMSLARAYFAICMGGSKEAAGKELGDHLAAGNTFDDLMTAMQKEMENSDFFQSLTKNQEKENPADSKKARKKNTEI